MDRKKNPENLGYILDFRRTPSNVEETSEGFWIAEGVAAVVGVMEYSTPGGTELQYVPAETLKDTAEQLIGLPVTDGHPPELVTNKNFKQYVVGVVRDAWFDEDTGKLWVIIVIHDAQAQEQIKSGKIALSPGYIATKSEDVPEGIEADLVQVDRDYNHLAIVQEGRGGNAVTLQVDEDGKVSINLDEAEEEEEDEENEEEEDEENEEEEDEENEEEEEDEEAEEDDSVSKAEYDKLKEKYDRLRGKVDAMEQQMNEDGLDEKIPRLVEEYNRAASVARQLGIQFDNKMGIRDLKRKVVQEKAERDVSDESDGYIDERFRAIEERYPAENSVGHLEASFDSKPVHNEDENDLDIDLPSPSQEFGGK